MFIPLNDHIEVEPINQESIVESQDTNFEEKGKIISMASSLSGWWPKVGDTVHFDSWLCAKYPDSNGKVRYLVPASAVRAYETESQPILSSSGVAVSKADFPPLHE